VAEGDVIAVMESMKLEISIRAAAAGIASNISVSNGDMVDRGQVIAEILELEE
jgi:3-methylcrotonyl-CoA carboxylase alpha subunit